MLYDTEQLFLDLFPKPKMFNVATHANSTKGLKHSDETKAFLRLKRLGKPLSEITKKKLSLLLAGVLNPFYGKKHTDATLIKLSELKKGDKNPMFGKEK